jgi:hypothetical protein
MVVKHQSATPQDDIKANASVSPPVPRANTKADKKVDMPGLLAGQYAKGKQDLMALINELRSDGAALEVE